MQNTPVAQLKPAASKFGEGDVAVSQLIGEKLSNWLLQQIGDESFDDVADEGIDFAEDPVQRAQIAVKSDADFADVFNVEESQLGFRFQVVHVLVFIN